MEADTSRREPSVGREAMNKLIRWLEDEPARIWYAVAVAMLVAAFLCSLVPG